MEAIRKCFTDFKTRLSCERALSLTKGRGSNGGVDGYMHFM